MTRPSDPPHGPGRRRRRPSAAVVSLLIAALAYSTLQMLVLPALPAIQRDLGADANAVAWVISAFLASTAVASPLAGRLGDLYGKRQVLVAVLLIFAAGGVVGVLASSIEVLIVARVLQGAGGAVFPLAYGLARDVVPPERVPVAIGTISGSFGVGGTAGLALSGPLVDHVAWQATVGLGALLGVLAAFCVVRFVPPAPPGTRSSLDVVGGVLLAVGLVLLLLGISGHVPAQTGGRGPAVGLGLAVLALWAAWERRHPVPLVDVRLLARRTVWPVNVAGAAVGFAMYAFGFLIPQLVQTDPEATGVGFGASVTTTSLFLLPALMSGLLAGTSAGILGRRYGSSWPFTAGLALMVMGIGGLCAGLHSAAAVAVTTLFANGIGLNLALAAMANLIIENAPAERTAEAAGMNTTVRTVGGALGTQVVALLLLVPDPAGRPSAAGFVLALGLCAALVVLALGLYAMAVRRPGPFRAVDHGAPARSEGAC